MSVQTVEDLSGILKASVEKTLKKLNAAGLGHQHAGDIVSTDEKRILLDFLKKLNVAKTIVEISNYSLDYVRIQLKEDSALNMVRELSSYLPQNVMNRFDVRLSAMGVLMIVARNALQNNEFNALCMIAVSISWAANELRENSQLSASERTYLEALNNEALELILANKNNVDIIVAQNYISASLLALYGEKSLETRGK